MSWGKEMMAALEADGEKLRQLTDEDHGPYFDEPPEVWEDCPACCGEGGYEKHIFVYERGCGFGHDDSMWVTCEKCNGIGGFICEALPNTGETPDEDE
jgi:DnaJ-class molecular chaperone